MSRTVLDLVRLSSGYLQQKRIPTPRLDAEVLLAHVLGCERIQLYVQFDRPLATAEVDRYRELIRRRAARVPVAHLTGTREFWSLEFEVGPQVLVPRPETEVLVQACLGRMEGEGEFADIGVGSGCIAVALLRERPGWTGAAVDRSPEALAVALANARRHAVAERLSLHHGDLLAPLAGRRFDLIVSNPPYIPTADLVGLEPEVVGNEPRLALDGGVDGLGALRALVQGAPAHLTGGGVLALEFGAGQERAVAALLGSAGCYGTPELIADHTDRPRVAVARKTY